MMGNGSNSIYRLPRSVLLLLAICISVIAQNPPDEATAQRTLIRGYIEKVSPENSRQWRYPS
jgi:hypothetical protein